MNGEPFDVSLSTVKRLAEPKERVEERLRRGGWEPTATTSGGRISFYENSGINLTVLQGPFGTLIFPSGLRGLVFGDEPKLFSRQSALGINERDETEDEVDDGGMQDAQSLEGEAGEVLDIGRDFETFE